MPYGNAGTFSDGFFHQPSVPLTTSIGILLHRYRTGISNYHGGSQPPEIRGICPKWTHLLPGPRSETLLKNIILERLQALMGSHGNYAMQRSSRT
ncbi:hypothetical protein EVAR_4234_1 [Eumeta japonica]|uniref:Uncharacterized protein n=1 Tax=Eumeta variegata TaxID=151549 RepID=A0A4C1TJ77_EUMVA|nr:hypothetical protein EVAR_4234_1 [Eumeta japonica]